MVVVVVVAAAAAAAGGRRRSSRIRGSYGRLLKRGLFIIRIIVDVRQSPRTKVKESANTKISNFEPSLVQ